MKPQKLQKDLAIAKLQVALAMVLLIGVNNAEAISAVTQLSEEDLYDWTYNPSNGSWQEDGLFSISLENYNPPKCIRSLAVELTKEIN